MQEIPKENVNPRISKGKKMVCGPMIKKQPRALEDYKLELNKHGLSVHDK